MGIKIDGKQNYYADALSRFKPYDWKQFGITVVDATMITNKILLKLKKYYPNRDRNEWKWNDFQRQLLKN